MLAFGTFGGLVLLQSGGGALLPILVFIAIVAAAIALVGRRARGKPQVFEAFSHEETMAKDIWQQKSDEELITASEHFSEYTEEAQEIIRAELQLRRMREPEPTVRPVEDEQSRQPINLGEKSISNNRTVIAVGMVIAVIGVALIIISSNLLLILQPQLMREQEAIQALQGPILFFGVVLLIVGGIISAVGFSKFISTRPTTPPAPTTQPFVTQSVSPKSVELGNTPDEVQSVMGQPDKIINLGARVTHIYKDMRIIYVDGKVSDVQLS